MTEIDLENPLSLLGSAENAKDYTFYLVLPKPNYTPQAFEQNPNVASGADLLFKSPVIPDKNGRSSVDLKPHADAIKKKLKDSITEVRGVLLGTEKSALGRRKAVVEPFKLKKAGNLELKALVGSCSPQDWVTYHHPRWFVELTVKPPITEIQIAYTLQSGMPPMHSMWESKAAGQLKAGRVVFGGLETHMPGAPGNAKACKMPDAPHSYGWWGSCGFIWQTPFTVKLLPGVERYIIGSYPRGNGNEVLTVSGTKDFANTKAQIELVQSGAHPHPGD